MKTSQVFLSHTSDLAVYPQSRSFVQAVLDAVARAGMVPVDMRYFAAREGQPADYCQQRVREFSPGKQDGGHWDGRARHEYAHEEVQGEARGHD